MRRWPKGLAPLGGAPVIQRPAVRGRIWFGAMPAEMCIRDSYNIAYADTLPDLDLMKDGVIVNPVAQEGSGYLVTSVTHNPIKTPLRWN